MSAVRRAGQVLRSRRWGYVAAGWAVLFASLHFFWALGGSAGLASAAGARLAAAKLGLTNRVQAAILAHNASLEL